MSFLHEFLGGVPFGERCQPIRTLRRMDEDLGMGSSRICDSGSQPPPDQRSCPHIRESRMCGAPSHLINSCTKITPLDFFIRQCQEKRPNIENESPLRQASSETAELRKSNDRTFTSCLKTIHQQRIVAVIH